MEINTKELFDKTIQDELLYSTEPEEVTVSPDELNGVDIYDEEVLADTLAKDFSYQIKNRGEDYYYSGNIQNIYNIKNMYYAKVNGNSNKPYNVVIHANSPLSFKYLPNSSVKWVYTTSLCMECNLSNSDTISSGIQYENIMSDGSSL